MFMGLGLRLPMRRGGGFSAARLPGYVDELDPGFGVTTNGAASFPNNVASYLSRASSPLLDITGDFTIDGWVYLNAYSADFDCLAAKGSAFYNFMVNDTGRLRWEIRTSTGYKTFLTTLTVPLTTLTYVAAQYDATNALLLVSINGGTPQTFAAGGTPLTDGSAFEMGVRDLGNFGLNGYLDAWAVRQTLLTQAELQGEYNGGAGRNRPNNTRNLSAYYKFNQGGATRVDYTSNALDLTQTGTVALIAGTISGEADEGDSIALQTGRNGKTATPTSVATRGIFRRIGGNPCIEWPAGCGAVTNIPCPVGAQTVAFGARQTAAGTTRIIQDTGGNMVMTFRRVNLKMYVVTQVAAPLTDFTGYNRMQATKGGGNWQCKVNNTDITDSACAVDASGFFVIGFPGAFGENVNGYTTNMIFTTAQTTAAEQLAIDTYLASKAV